MQTFREKPLLVALRIYPLYIINFGFLTMGICTNCTIGILLQEINLKQQNAFWWEICDCHTNESAHHLYFTDKCFITPRLNFSVLSNIYTNLPLFHLISVSFASWGRPPTNNFLSSSFTTLTSVVSMVSSFWSDIVLTED